MVYAGSFDREAALTTVIDPRGDRTNELNTALTGCHIAHQVLWHAGRRISCACCLPDATAHRDGPYGMPTLPPKLLLCRGSADLHSGSMLLAPLVDEVCCCRGRGRTSSWIEQSRRYGRYLPRQALAVPYP